MADWMVQIKGRLPYRREDDDQYEISVIQENNEQGQHSWGWGALNKIILFSTSLGGNQISPKTAVNVNFALRIADGLCTLLNSW